MGSPDVPIYTTLEEARNNLTRPVVPIGNFDGVHIGHRSIFDHANSVADARVDSQGTRPTVAGLTFTPHPIRFFKPDADDFRLMSDAHKFRRMGEAGVDAVIALTFDENIANKPPGAFVRSILHEGLDAAHVVVGSTFRFGKNRSGSTEDLERLCSDLNIGCDVLKEVTHDGEIVSSTRIRELLAEGKLQQAATLLGRPYSITGRVVRGAGRGTDLGYPTANIDPGNPVLVPNGVFASRLMWDDTTQLAATSIGVRPTFADEDSVTVEAFVIDAPDDLDLYDKHVELQLDRYLRPELEFDNEQGLIEQMDEDVRSIRAHYTQE